MRGSLLLVNAVACLICAAQAFQGNPATGTRASSALQARASAAPSKTKQCTLIEIDDPEADAWRLTPAIVILRSGGLGIIPTDTSYVFACDLHSRRGVDRIFELKKFIGKKKPLSLLCKDISTISKHTDGIDKDLFKAFRKALPGPYTFILPATHEVPRVLLEHKHHKKTWKRREVGVRIPNHPVLLALLADLDGSVPLSNNPNDNSSDQYDDDSDSMSWSEKAKKNLATDPQRIYDEFGSAVDFIVAAGAINSSGVSTVIDCMSNPAKVIRQGMGSLATLDMQVDTSAIE
eukprot:11832-Heterococcus_DN1.PRE.3